MRQVPHVRGYGAAARAHADWRLWELDSELRYRPVVHALAEITSPICEIGSGPVGLAGWTDRQVIGVDPMASDVRHGEDVVSPPNLERRTGSGADIPLADGSVAAAVAVDTFEHIPAVARGQVVAEMVRVVRPGGRVIVIGPTGPAAAEGDRRLAARLAARGNPPWARWLQEHFEMGLPTEPELRELFVNDRVNSVRLEGVFNLRLWEIAHLVGMGALPRLKHAHRPVYAGVRALSRYYHRPPTYRTLVVAEIK